MSNFRLEDDFFSPVRFDNSTIGESSSSSDESLNDLLNAEKSSLTGFVKNKVSLDKDMTESSHENELKSQDKNIINFISPVQFDNSTIAVNRGSSDKSLNGLLNVEKSSLKLEKFKDTKIVARKKENVKSQQRTQESLSRENIVDSHSAKSDISEKLHQKKSRTSLLTKTENAKLDLPKNVKKRQKSSIQSSKCCYEDALSKSSMKQSVQKKLSGSSSNTLEKINDIKLKDSSIISKESEKNTSTNNSESKKSDIASQQKEKMIVNPLHSSYEATIKMMIHSSISSESAKLRQLMYMQQMSFYREMNKLKDEMKKQHLVTTERLFKVIGELVQMNTSLELALSNKN